MILRTIISIQTVLIIQVTIDSLYRIVKAMIQITVTLVRILHIQEVLFLKEKTKINLIQQEIMVNSITSKRTTEEITFQVSSIILNQKWMK